MFQPRVPVLVAPTRLVARVGISLFVNLTAGLLSPRLESVQCFPSGFGRGKLCFALAGALAGADDFGIIAQSDFGSENLCVFGAGHFHVVHRLGLAQMMCLDGQRGFPVERRAF